MSKRFVKNRYPEAYAVKSCMLDNKTYKYFIINKDGHIMKGSAKTEKDSWENLANIIKEIEKKNVKSNRTH